MARALRALRAVGRAAQALRRPRTSSSSSRRWQRKSNAFYSMGITKHDLDKFERVHAKAGDSNPLRLHRCRQRLHRELSSSSSRSSAARYPKLTLMAGNVVTGEMTEELILSRRRHRQGRHRPGLGLHDAHDDRRRLSAAVGGDRVRRRRARTRRAHLRRRRLHRAGRSRQGVRRRRRLRHAGRHVRRPRRVRGRRRRARRQAATSASTA